MRDSVELRLIDAGSDILVVGGGPVGSFFAALFAQEGHDLKVVDKRPDPRSSDGRGGRSINLTMSERGLSALDRIGLRETVLENSVPYYGRVIHTLEDAPRFERYGDAGEAIYGIARHELTRLLVDAAEARGARYSFRTSCETVDLEEPAVRLRMPNGQHRELAGDLVVAADGAYSTIRSRMQRLRYFNYSQTYSRLEYSEFVVSAEHASSWSDHRNAIHVWPRGQFMLIGFPNIDGSLTLSLLLPRVGPISHDELRTTADLEHLFTEHFPDVLVDARAELDGYFDRATGSMVTIQCDPWSVNGRVLLLGDAAHAIFPSYGQGCNSSLEGCTELLEAVRQCRDWGEALLLFQTQRHREADAIGVLSMEHFEVLNRGVAQQSHRDYETISRAIHALDPTRGSLYHNVSFTTLPYTEAIKRERAHEALVGRVRTLLDGGLELHEAATRALNEVGGPG